MGENRIVLLAKQSSGLLAKYILAFFIIYSVLQSTAVSLVIGNHIIISTLFIALCIHLILTMICKGILIFPCEGKVSIFSFIKGIDIFVGVFLAINSIWILFIPNINGFSISSAISEAGMLLIFIIYFPLAILIRMKEIEYKSIVRNFFYACFALACLHVIIWLIEYYNLGSFQEIINSLAKVPIFKTNDIITGWGIIRISVSSSVLLGSGLFLLCAKNKPLNFFDFFIIVVFTFAIIGTFLRSLWIGVALAFFILVCYSTFTYARYKKSTSVFKVLGIFIITAIILNATVFQYSISNRFLNTFINSNSIANSIQDESLAGQYDNIESQTIKPELFDHEKDKEGAKVSNDIKIEQVKQLLIKWSEKPLTGFGYGSYIRSYLRSNTKTFAYEMTFFSLLMKIGIFGLLSWILLLISTCVYAYKNTQNNRSYFFIFLAITSCFLITIQTNPLLFSANSLGFIIYLILFTVDQENRLGK